MKKLNVLKSAVSALIASVMLGTAMLPATASEVDASNYTKGLKYYYIDEWNDGVYRLFCIADSDAFYTAINNLQQARVRNEETGRYEFVYGDLSYAELRRMALDGLETYRFEDCMLATINRAVMAWATGLMTEEEMDSYIQTVAEGGTLPEENKLELTFDADSFQPKLRAVFGNISADPNIDPPLENYIPPHDLTELDEKLKYYLAKYSSEVESVKANVVEFDFARKSSEQSEVEVSFQGATISGAAAEAFMQALIGGSGDINGNSEADLTDAVLLARAVGGTYEVSAASRREADLNGDQNVDQNDLNALLRVLAGA